MTGLIQELKTITDTISQGVMPPDYPWGRALDCAAIPRFSTHTLCST